MKTHRLDGCLVAALMALAGITLCLADTETQTRYEQRFAWVDVYLDGPVPLAAYQFSLGGEADSFRIVGIEGGEHGAFAAAPYYDPAALQRGNVIVGAFSTDPELPPGRTRVARIHVLLEGPDPDYAATLLVAAGADGRPMQANITLEQGADA